MEKHDLSRTRAVCAATVGTPRRCIGNLGIYRTKPAVRRTGWLQPRTRPAIHRQNAVGNRRRTAVCGIEKARRQNHGAGQPPQAVFPAAGSFRQPESFAAARKRRRPAAYRPNAKNPIPRARPASAAVQISGGASPLCRTVAHHIPRKKRQKPKRRRQMALSRYGGRAVRICRLRTQQPASLDAEIRPPAD